jgi:signal transduction histidine kinase/HAMP domain-containing protein/ActR/RegA family two-component response regulator
LEEGLASRPDGALPNGRRLDRASAVNRGLGRFGLRVRLGAIAMAVAIPLLAANVVWLSIGFSDARTAATAETGRLADAVSSALDQALEGTRTALVTIAAEDELQNLDAERCSMELAELLPEFAEYGNLSAADRDGRVFCSAVPSTGTVEIDDRDYFQLVIGGASFAIGGYQIGRIVGRQVIVGAVPIRGATGEIVGTAQASITLASLAAIVGQVDLPPGAALTVLDRDGTVLVRVPDEGQFVGQLPPEDGLLDALLDEHSEAENDHGNAVSLFGPDGVERLYAIKGTATGGDAIHVAVGFSVDQAYAGPRSRFAAGMAVLLAALLLGLGLMVTFARGLIVRPVQSLVVAANQIAEGDLTARTGMAGNDEIGRLADAFDRMADSVQSRVEARTADLTTAIAERTEADRRVREYLDAAVDPLLVAGAIRDSDGAVVDFQTTYANEPGVDILGPALTRIGWRVSELPAELARLRMYRGVVEDGRPVEFETSFRHARTNEEVELSARAAKIGDGVAIVFRDVTPAKALQRALESARTEAVLAREAAESARAEAERANLSKTEFLSRMSHELRTPLNAVIGFAQILELDDLDGEQAESVDHILRSGRHLLDLINEVLDISRIESGTFTTSPEAVDVHEAVTEAVGLITPLAKGRDLTIAVREPEDPALHVLADRQRLKQILLNLLSNAVKFNRPSGTIEVEASLTRAGRCRISVRDEGPGIPEAMRERVFAPFDRLGAESGRIEGTGLGLSLSRALAEPMDGTIDFESIAGHGSTFWVELPITAEAPTDTEAATTPPPTARARAGTVLYIEDNLSNLELVSRIFERQGGIRVVPAMLARLGLELARDRPDLILLDLHLPDMSGEEVLTRLLADPVTREIPVVVMSADASPGIVDRLMAMGASAFVTKPISIREFIAVVDRLLADRPRSPDLEPEPDP